MENKFLDEQEYNHIFSKVPRICVDLLIFNEKDFLLTKRTIEPYKNFWHIPGGRVYFGESFEKAAQRIAKKELNINVELKDQISCIEWFDEEKLKLHDVSIIFLATTNTRNIELNKEASEFGFFQFVPEGTIKEHKDFLNNYLNKHKQ